MVTIESKTSMQHINNQQCNIILLGLRKKVNMNILYECKQNNNQTL
jgi:hypothetical protein